MNKTIITIGLLILFFITGCKTEKIIYVRAISGPMTFQKQVKKDLFLIEKKLKKKVFFNKVGNYPISITLASIDPEEMGFAYVEADRCDITISQSLKKKNMIKLILFHEIGHCIGLDHGSTNEGRIMDGEIDSNESDDEIARELADLPKFLTDLDKLIVDKNNLFLIQKRETLWDTIYFSIFNERSLDLNPSEYD